MSCNGVRVPAPTGTMSACPASLSQRANRRRRAGQAVQSLAVFGLCVVVALCAAPARVLAAPTDTAPGSMAEWRAALRQWQAAFEEWQQNTNGGCSENDLPPVDLSDTPSLQLMPSCAWHFVSDGTTFNVAFPDLNSIYQVMLLYLNEGDAVEYTGSFPQVRYFSYQTYEMSTFLPLGSIRDYEVPALTKKNPFAESIDRAESGTYKLYIVPQAEGEFETELAALLPNQTSGLASVFLRLYAVDESVPSSNPYRAAWGGVPPPTVRLRRGKTGEWTTLTQCRQRHKGIVIPDNPNATSTCAFGTNTANNAFLPNNANLKFQFASYDASYLLACVTPTQSGKKVVARVTSNLPTTAVGLYSPVRPVNAYASYAVRYVSVSPVSRTKGHQVFFTYRDSQIADHYVSTMGSDAWEAAGRPFTIWMADSNETAIAAGADLTADMYAPWPGESLLGVLYRQVLSYDQREGTTTSGNSVAAIYDTCAATQPSGTNCYAPAQCQAVMGATYPSIEYLFV